MNRFVGIDLGTTGARSIIYDETLRPLGESYHEYPLQYPRAGWVEQDAELWWSLTCQTVREALDASDGTGPVQGLAVSSQSISVVPTDGAFVPLRPAISWLDQRAGDELTEIVARYGRMLLYEATGKRASASYTLPKLIWMQRYEPELFAAARYFLLPHDFLMARLTDRPATDHTLAAGTMLYSLAEEDWWVEAAGAFGVDMGKLAPLYWGGTPAGGLTAAAAEAVGLPAGTPVFVGGQDQKCAALAAGLKPGAITVSLGTAAALEALDVPGQDDNLPRFPFFAPGQRVLEGVVPTAGLALRWLRDVLFSHLDYDALGDMARPYAGQNHVLFAPYLSGEGSPGWREDAQAGFTGLTLGTEPGQLACAVMEGVAFEFKRNLQAMGAGPNHTLRLFGGGAKSAVWPQIIADITALSVEVMQMPEMACLGAALLAARGSGCLPAEAPPPTPASRTVIPRSIYAAHYQTLYARYLDNFAASEKRRNPIHAGT